MDLGVDNAWRHRATWTLLPATFRASPKVNVLIAAFDAA